MQPPLPARKILYIQYTNPGAYPPLEHSSRILADLGWQVLFLGTGSFGAGNLRFPSNPGITVRLLAYRAGGIFQKVHYILYCLWVLLWSLRKLPTVLYASDPLSTVPALLVHLLLARPVVYHEHDSPDPLAGGSMFFRGILAARKHLARRARANVLPNEERARVFRDETQTVKPVLTVWNCPSRQEALPNSLKSDSSLVIFYHGSIVPERLPLGILNAMADVANVRFVFAGYQTAGSQGYVDSLLERARQLKMAERVTYLGPVPLRSDLLAACRQAHVGLAFMPMQHDDLNLRAMTGASNKPFDYMACGLALIVSDLPEWRAMFVQPGYAVACQPSDNQTLATILRRFADDLTTCLAAGEAGRQRILSGWNYETQFAAVLQTLNDDL